jgi:hypothetical protein
MTIATAYQTDTFTNSAGTTAYAALPATTIGYGAARDSYGAGQNAGVSQFGFFSALIFTDQAGTAYIDTSPTATSAADTSWQQAATVAISASTPVLITAPVLQQFYRIRINNTSASPQTILNVRSGFTVTAPGSGGGSVTVSGTAQVVGDSANAATDSGSNPVKIGGVYLSTPATYTTGQRGNYLMGAKGGFPIVAGSAAVAAADAVSNTNTIQFNTYANTSGLLQIAGFVFNGTTWDRAYSGAGSASAGAGIGAMAVEESGRAFTHISTATTTTVKSGKGNLHQIVIGTYIASATITIYDNTAASGTIISTLTLPSTITSLAPVSIPFDIAFSTGLTIVTSGATDITVSYR